MHADVTGKYCPAPWLDRPAEWEAFRPQSRQRGVSADQPAAAGQMYRVRKVLVRCQKPKRAFTVLSNAKTCADQNPGYTVFDNSGKAVYTSQGGTSAPSTPAKEAVGCGRFLRACLCAPHPGVFRRVRRWGGI